MNNRTVTVILSFLFVAFASAQSLSWLQISIYGSNPSCSGNEPSQYILYNLNSCIKVVDNDTYPFCKFTCDGTQSIFMACQDSNCASCVPDGAGETLNECSSEDGDGQIFTCFQDQDWYFENYTFASGPAGAGLNFDNGQCSGDPYAVTMSAMPTECDNNGEKWSCENGDVFKYECDSGCSNCQKTSYSVCSVDNTYQTSSTYECAGGSSGASQLAAIPILIFAFVLFMQ